MNSRVSWSVDGIEPSVRERAEAAARRAGMSLGDWLNSTIGEAPPRYNSPNARPRDQERPLTPRAALPQRDAADVVEIHERLDAIARQIELFSKPAQRSSEPGVARQLNDAISRLDARLSQISEPTYRPAPPPQQPRIDMVERAANQVYSASPPIDPFSLDFAIAEIAARQGELDGTPRMAPRNAPPIAPSFVQPPYAQSAMPPQSFMPDMSGLERQLFQITTKIDALQRPDNNIEQSIAAFRGELADIRNVITEAMPRRAIESIENEIRELGRRIDDNRHSGIDGDVLANLERALADIHKTLTTLTPAEQLAGFDEAIRNLGGKIDLIVRSSNDPGTMEQLQGAITALRAIVSNVASNEALGRLSDDLQTLSSKVDQLARADNSDSFAALEARIMTLTAALENRDRPAVMASSDHLETALRTLSERLDHMPVGNDSSSAFAHLEQRVSYLLERMENITDTRGNNLGRVEDGLQDILRHLERQQSLFAALDNPRSKASSIDPGLVDTIKRELSDMRFSQSETDRHTQDSLEVVHSTLGHVVDRLARIEGDLRAVSAAPAKQSAPVATPAPTSRPATAPAVSVPAPTRPQMPNPVKPQAAPSQVEVRPPQVHFDAAPRDFAATAISHEPASAFPMPKAISDILDPPPAPKPVAQSASAAERPSPRPMVDPALPPDHPLEPGTRPQGRGASPSERIAASEDAISEIAVDAPKQATASSFIAAARRAAQAAAATGNDKSRSDKSRADKSKATRPGPQLADSEKSSSTIGSKIRSLLVGASVVVIVLGSFKMAMTLLDSGSPAPVAENIHSAPPLQLNAPEPAEALTKPAAPVPATPSMTSPTPIGKQSLIAPPPAAVEPAPQPVPQAAPVPYVSPDVTGSIAAPQASAAGPVLPSSGQKITTASIPAGERLPETIGSTALRNAALKGDASAAFEIGVRYAEGKGVAQNYDEAAKWYDRAAQANVVPAMFRLGALFEKGLGAKKDLDVARRYYVLAADRGNAKAMHNLAVLDADGGTKGANYKSASYWFRKAADRGVADSQFNLGILYARGIGVEQNLAESFKWFSLAASQGDVDAGRKRDDIAKRLDPQSLAAARLAVQTFAPEGQPEDAINVATPAGGWDAAPAQVGAKASMGKRAAR
ncbi:localization factor PodJL [Tardiphaga sp. OK246]|uniref:tetratricopeptide repeat protein n=1 Tax=Tardiphaga sp. OK246 TaxID=1855307 RepID=UPI000B6C5BDB|nr:tetratricopeptide repeat protein [Tardiphaga sp. OK246]SNT57724.1 localization factor PodJL [Tardiphaga sp. OK246]